MRKPFVVYISGKISGVPDLNRKKFEDTTNRLRYFILRSDDVVINPHELPAEHDKSWSSYMRVCIKALCGANYVVALDDWKDSRGAIIEVLMATVMAIPVARLEGYKFVDIKITLPLFCRLLFKLLLNRFANAKDYQPK